MIRCFIQSKCTLVGGILLTLSLGVVLAIRQVDNERWVFILSLLLFAMIGTLLTLFVSNLVATSCNQKALALLYVDRKPDVFVDTYAKVPQGLKTGTMAHATAIAYLADGLLSAGRADEALAALEKIQTDDRISLELLVEDTRIRAWLLQRELTPAKEGLRRYQRGLARARTENPSLATNLFSRYEALHQELLFRQGKQTNLAQIHELQENANVILRRLELMLLEGEILLAKGQTQEGTHLLKQVAEAGGALHLVDVANTLLASAESVQAE